MLVWIRCSSFLMEILFIFVTPYLPRADAISSSVSNANSLLLITSLEVLIFSCRYALHLVVWKVFIFNLFSSCLQLSTLTSKLPFLFTGPVHLHPLGVLLVLGMNQGGNPFTLFEMGATRRVYSCWRWVSKPLPVSSSQHWSNSYSQHDWPSATAFYQLTDKGWELAASADLKVWSG